MAGGGSDCQHRTAVTNVEGDGDGSISAADHAAGAQKRFDTMDANRDGKLTATEINASHGAESVAWSKQRMTPAEKIKQLDANKDGAVTAEEYAAGSQRLFTTLDVDGDGYLSPAEMSVDSKNRMSARDDG
jgi:Ca2+-binding EF-hand superfamily protein